MSNPTDLEVSTAEIIKRRLIGLLVLVVVVFGLSMLRRLGGSSADESRLQTVVIPLGGNELPAADTALAGPGPAAVADAPAAAPVTTPRPDIPVESAPVPKLTEPKPAKSATAAPRGKEKEREPASQIPKKNHWYILLGSFSDAANARALAQRAKSAGFSTEVSRIQSGGGTLNRVRAGPFKSESEAQSARATLIVEGLTSAKLQKEP